MSRPKAHDSSFKNKNGVVQRFRCVRCGKTLSELQPLDGLRIDRSKVVLIANLLTEGLGCPGLCPSGRLPRSYRPSVLELIGEEGAPICAGLKAAKRMGEGRHQLRRDR